MQMLGRIQSPSANREGPAQSLNSPLRHQEALRLECSPQVSAPVVGNRPLTKQLFQGSRVQLPEGLDPIGATFVVSAPCGRIGEKALDVPSPKNKQFGDERGGPQTFQPLSTRSPQGPVIGAVVSQKTCQLRGSSRQPRIPPSRSRDRQVKAPSELRRAPESRSMVLSHCRSQAQKESRRLYPSQAASAKA